MPPKRKVAKKPKKRVTQKQKQAQKQVVNIVLGSKRGRPRKRGMPRQSAAPQAQQGRYLQQFVQPNQMIPSNQINPTIVPAPFGEPLITNPSNLSFAPNAQPSIYRNMRRETPSASRENKSFAWSGPSGSITEAKPPPVRLTDRQVRSVSAAKAVARQSDAKIKQTIARSEEAERALMGAADAEAFMMRTPLPMNFGFRTPATTSVVEPPSSQPSNDPFPSASSQGGGVIMEGRSLFKD